MLNAYAESKADGKSRNFHARAALRTPDPFAQVGVRRQVTCPRCSTDTSFQNLGIPDMLVERRCGRRHTAGTYSRPVGLSVAGLRLHKALCVEDGTCLGWNISFGYRAFQG